MKWIALVIVMVGICWIPFLLILRMVNAIDSYTLLYSIITFLGTFFITSIATTIVSRLIR